VVGAGPPSGGDDQFDGLLGRRLVEVADGDRAALAGQGQGGRPADPRSGAGDDGDLPLELSHGAAPCACRTGIWPPSSAAYWSRDSSNRPRDRIWARTTTRAAPMATYSSTRSAEVGSRLNTVISIESGSRPAASALARRA